MNSVMNDIPQTNPDSIKSDLTNCLKQQRAAYHADPTPDLEQRKTDLLALKSMISDNTEAIIDAINKDYGNRSRHETLFAELILTLELTP